MAFMTAPTAAGPHEDSPPVLGFNAKAGRLFLLDRFQDAAGEWSSVKTDVTMQPPPFAVDFGRLETGWIHFAHARAPEFVLVPHGQQCPPEPASPGVNSLGKALRFKAGFRLPVISNAIGGVREMAGNSGALITGMNDLHTAYERADEARAGQIPAVRLTNVIEVQSGRSSNFQPVFTIIAWIERPAILGPRTVPPPGAKPEPQPTRIVHPLARTPAPTPAAPRDDWRDEFGAASMPVNGHATSATGWADSEIPF